MIHDYEQAKNEINKISGTDFRKEKLINLYLSVEVWEHYQNEVVVTCNILSIRCFVMRCEKYNGVMVTIFAGSIYHN